MIVEFPNDNNKGIYATNKLDEESCNEVIEEEIRLRENPYYEAIATLEEFKLIDDWSAVYMPQLHDALDTVIDAVRHRIHKGEWIETDKGTICNHCGEESRKWTNFCPNCGADMRGGRE